ncbi:hypothetical protein MTR67_009367 [Solanum verrucosum]|uniref:Uncharacterized protein n=1 Tax=Solanum verrucosum TaxID=315347 RepID=A0AAF0TDA6_SOLVR|nr:hypothetical protein MTR67_009367 [Solanum verrucosum]
MINYANNSTSASSSLMPNQSSDQEFRRFTTITGASVMMSMVRDRSLLEALMREGVILPDPEIIDANNTEPLNLELTLAPPVMTNVSIEKVKKDVPSSSKTKIGKPLKKGIEKYHPQFLVRIYPRDCGLFVAAFAEFLTDEIPIQSNAFRFDYHRTRYATLL